MIVANRFLADVELEDESLKGKLALHMALEHLRGRRVAESAQTQRRIQRMRPSPRVDRLLQVCLERSAWTSSSRSIGWTSVSSTLKESSTGVAELKIDLERTMVMVEEKKKATDELIVEMGISRNIAEKEGAAANIEAEKAGVASRPL